MRSLINSLCQLYGPEHVGQITKWVNEQYLFIASVDNLEFTLADLDEDTLIRIVESACTKLKLTVDMLTGGTWLIPKLSERQLEIEACIELRPELFKMVLGNKVKVVSESVAFAGDIVERFGADQHIRLTPGDTGSTDIECMFINLLVCTENEELPISVSMNALELEEVQRLYFEDKYNSANPFSLAHWQHLQLSALYRRLGNDAIFSLIESVLDDEAITLYRQIAAFGHDEIKSEKQHGSEKIFSEYGAQIGYKVVRHNFVELLASKRAVVNVESARAVNSAGSEAKVMPFVKPEPTRNVHHESEYSDGDVATEWGGF